MKYDQLPVYLQKNRIVDELAKNQVIVIESPTGSGKTTQIPVILNEAGYSKSGIIGITQPRRIAALSVCEFISKQLNTKTGTTVGYKMRFEDKTSSETIIKIMTDGILLQEMKTDPMLSRYSVIMVDEAHERSLNIDFILGLLKKLLTDRNDLKVVISSATINSSIFSKYFNNCPIVKINTPIYPIDLNYHPIDPTASEEKFYKEITKIVEKYVKSKKHSDSEKNLGDILIFLQGERNIKDCTSALMDSPIHDKLFILQLYGRLSKEEQERVFIPTPKGKTKVVISTNIAETSVTIEGIRLVIDPGVAKINFYNPSTFTSSLMEQLISKASANQRKGRAGRTAAGICYRLYSEDDFNRRKDFTLEEIYRTDLSEVILRMSDLAITNFEDFDYISPPKKEGILGAIQTLKMLKAIDENHNLTEIGRRMVYFPLSPRHSRILVEAIIHYPNILEEILIATSFITTNTPYLLPQGEEIEARMAHHQFRDKHGDFVSYLKLFKRYQQAEKKEDFCKSFYLDQKTMNEIVSIKNQLEEMVSELGIPILSGGGVKDYLMAIATGLIQFVCVNYRQNAYKSLTAEKISIHPGSGMFRERPSYIVAGEIIKTSKMFARSVSPLHKEWLENIHPNLLKQLNEKKSRKEKSFEQSDKKEKRDAPNQLILAGHKIELRAFKGKKKLALINWDVAEALSKSMSYSELLRYSKMRGVICYHNKELFYNHKIPNLILAAKHIDPDSEWIKESFNKSWYAAQTPKEVLKRLDWILKLCSYKKRGVATIALYTDGSGRFWFAPCPSFVKTIETSINSMEELLEEVYDLIGDKEKDKFNEIYSHIAKIQEEREQQR